MLHPHSLQERVAVVTGAARGIGRAIVSEFIQAEVQHVVCADLLADELADLQREFGDRVTTLVHDITDAEGWQALVSQTLSAHGRLDILVNNAGILIFGTLEETAPEDFKRLMEVNVFGAFLGMQAVLPPMKQAKQGAIVNISSVSGVVPSNFVGAYSASKFAVRGLTRVAALEFGLDGIRVNSVHPGGVNTLMTNPMNVDRKEIDAIYNFVPLQRSSQPEEIARGVTYLASDAAAYCNGTELIIDGGMAAGLYFPGLPGAPQ